MLRPLAQRSALPPPRCPGKPSRWRDLSAHASARDGVEPRRRRRAAPGGRIRAPLPSTRPCELPAEPGRERAAAGTERAPAPRPSPRLASPRPREEQAEPPLSPGPPLPRPAGARAGAAGTRRARTFGDRKLWVFRSVRIWNPRCGRCYIVSSSSSSSPIPPFPDPSRPGPRYPPALLLPHPFVPLASTPGPAVPRPPCPTPPHGIPGKWPSPTLSSRLPGVEAKPKTDRSLERGECSRLPPSDPSVLAHFGEGREWLLQGPRLRPALPLPQLFSVIWAWADSRIPALPPCHLPGGWVPPLGVP